MKINHGGKTKLGRLPGFVCALGLTAGVSTQLALASDPQTIGELHPPVVASLGDQKITVFFLKNNLKQQATEVHVPAAEIFYSAVNATKPTLNYVWKVEGDQIASVFFHERKSPGRAGKSMYVLTEMQVSNRSFEGASYSVMELPLIKDGSQLSLNYFRGDPPEPEFQNCRDGLDLEESQEVVCAYKDAASVKKRLSVLDGQAVEQPQPKPVTVRANATAMACPSPDFSTFLAAFSEHADVQKAFVLQPLQMVTTVAGDPEPEMQKRSLSGDELKFPIIPDLAKREAQGLTLTVKEERGDKATAILQKPDTDYVFEYRFERGQCWQLKEVMDYSL